jgi:hypothetical protein
MVTRACPTVSHTQRLLFSTVRALVLEKSRAIKGEWTVGSWFRIPPLLLPSESSEIISRMKKSVKLNQVCGAIVSQQLRWFRRTMASQWFLIMNMYLFPPGSRKYKGRSRCIDTAVANIPPYFEDAVWNTTVLVDLQFKMPTYGCVSQQKLRARNACDIGSPTYTLITSLPWILVTRTDPVFQQPSSYFISGWCK